MRSSTLFTWLAGAVLAACAAAPEPEPSPTPPPQPTNLTDACTLATQHGAQRLTQHGAHAITLVPRQARLVLPTDDTPTLPAALAQAVAPGKRLAFSAQAVWTKDGQAQVLGQAWHKQEIVHEASPGDPSTATPNAFATLDLLEVRGRARLEAYLGPPRTRIPERRAALGGLLPMWTGGERVAHARPDAGTSPGKLLLGLNGPFGCAVILAEPSSSDAVAPHTAEQWTADLVEAGYRNVLLVNDQGAPHLVVAPSPDTSEVLIEMAPQHHEVVRFGVVMSW